MSNHAIRASLLKEQGNDLNTSSIVQNHKSANTSLPVSPLKPTIRLAGNVDGDMADRFWKQMQESLETKDESPGLLCLTTTGGDADVGRRIAEDIRLWQDYSGRTIYFLGKTSVYSAGATIMSVFPRERRFLTADCMLLIHERHLSRDVRLDGSLEQAIDVVNDVLTQCWNSQTIEDQSFEALARGSKLAPKDLRRLANHEWYVTPREALDLGLIEGIV